MKVLIVRENYHPNILGIVHGLRAHGHHVELLLNDPPRDSVRGIEGAPVQVEPLTPTSQRLARRLGLKPPHVAWPSIKRTWRHIQSRDPDVVLLKKTRLPQAVAGACAVLQRKPRVVVTDRPLSRRGRVLQRLGIVPRRHLTAGIDSDADLRNPQIRFLTYPAAELASAPPREGYRGPKLRVLCIGKFSSRRKRQQWLVEAVAMRGLQERVELTFVGTWSDRGPETHDAREVIRARERDLDLPSSKVLTNLSWAEVQDLYQHHDVHVLPARDEPHGAVVTEAMAHGLVTVCSDTCGARGAFREGEGGFTFSTAEASSLGQVLEHLSNLSHEELLSLQWRALGEAQRSLDAKKWVREFESLVQG